MLVSALCGIASLVLLWFRRYVAVRFTAALAVTAVLWGWGIAQYPNLLPGLTVAEAAADPTVLRNTLWIFAIGALVLIPSLGWMFVLFQREPGAHEAVGPHVSR
jgi:cytochrome d ubiquinol oxidase subunit II